MNEDNIIYTARNAFKRKSPAEFLKFLRKYRRTYDSDRLRTAFNRMEQEALNRLEEVQA